MGKESLFWGRIRDDSRGIPDLDIHRIENALSAGTPDVEGCFCSFAFQIELKASERPTRETSQLNYELTTTQAHWLRRRWNVGGSSWLYMRLGKGPTASYYLIRGRDAGEFITRQPVTTFQRLAVLPSDHSWQDALYTIVTRPKKAMSVDDIRVHARFALELARKNLG